MVHFPASVQQGKAWGFTQPYFGPYKLTPTNAEVRLVDLTDEETLFGALDLVRPCYAEKKDEVWVGHVGHSTSRFAPPKKRSKMLETSSRSASLSSLKYTGLVMGFLFIALPGSKPPHHCKAFDERPLPNRNP